LVEYRDAASNTRFDVFDWNPQIASAADKIFVVSVACPEFQIMFLKFQ
jgi:hypothetical protein